MLRLNAAYKTKTGVKSINSDWWTADDNHEMHKQAITTSGYLLLSTQICTQMFRLDTTFKQTPVWLSLHMWIITFYHIIQIIRNIFTSTKLFTFKSSTDFHIFFTLSTLFFITLSVSPKIVWRFAVTYVKLKLPLTVQGTRHGTYLIGQDICCFNYSTLEF